MALVTENYNNIRDRQKVALVESLGGGVYAKMAYPDLAMAWLGSQGYLQPTLVARMYAWAADNEIPYWQAAHSLGLIANIWEPTELFSASEQGAWYDPSDLSTMYQDTATMAPAAVNQPVGVILDKRLGLVRGSELFSDLPVLGEWVSNGGGSWTVTNATSTTDLRNNNQVVAGRVYEYTYTVTTNNNLTVYLGNGAPVLRGTGTYKDVFYSNQLFLIFRASTGTTATVSNISVRELPGNHATQPTTANKPVLSARANALVKSENVMDSAWLVSGGTKTLAAVQPEGFTNAATFTHDGTTGVDSSFFRQVGAAGSVERAHFLARAVSGSGIVRLRMQGLGVNQVTVNLNTGTVDPPANNVLTATISPHGNGWYWVTATFAPGSGNNDFRLLASQTGDVFSLAAAHSGADSAYQRVNTATDYDTVGFPHYLKFDGIDDFLSTASINFTATDKMTVFAGVRKLSDASAGLAVELSVSITANNGAFNIFAPTGGNDRYGFNSKGTGLSSPFAVGYPAPTTNILTGLADISADSAALRIDGASAATSALDQGTGNYGNHPLYIGRRGGTALPFNGHLYSLIVRGATTDAEQIANAESFTADKTGVTL